MKLKIFFETKKRKETVTLKSNSRVDDLLREMRINPETVLVMLNGEFVVGEEKLRENDILRIVSVK